MYYFMHVSGASCNIYSNQHGPVQSGQLFDHTTSSDKDVRLASIVMGKCIANVDDLIFLMNAVCLMEMDLKRSRRQPELTRRNTWIGGSVAETRGLEDPQ